MATSTTVTISDDLDGSKGAQTVKFSLDGADFEIDLSAKNRTALEKALAPFVKAARSAPRSTLASPAATGRGRKPSAGKPAAAGVRTPKDELAAIRAWAAEAGVPIAARGRISGEIRSQYAAATAQ